MCYSSYEATDALGKSTAHSCSASGCTRDGSQIHAQYEFGFPGFPPVGYEHKDPVHENIALAAFIRSSKSDEWKTVTYATLTDSQFEFMRGIIWNDDPECLLFLDSKDSNRTFGNGADFGSSFKGGNPKKMTQRSHFRDLQYLHSMAIRPNETANATRDAILEWFEVMYKLAIYEDSRKISGTTPLGNCLARHFPDGSIPSKDNTLKDLILGSTPSYTKFDLNKRALGICLHMIQDSFAIGHTQRRLQNAEFIKTVPNEKPETYLAFKEGHFGHFGDILAFHTYDGQDKTRHGHYDALNGAVLKPDSTPTFSSIHGANDAIDKCKELINFYYARTAWSAGVSDWARLAFKLDDQVKPADTKVDLNLVPALAPPQIQSMGALSMGAERQAVSMGHTNDNRIEDDDEYAYRMGMARKLNSLEYGLIGPAKPSVYPTARTTLVDRLRGMSYCCCPSWPGSVLASVAIVFGLIATMLLSIFIWVLPKTKALTS